jgi:hypothetical protein
MEHRYDIIIQTSLLSAGALVLGLTVSTVTWAAQGKSCDRTYTIGFSHPVGESQFARLAITLGFSCARLAVITAASGVNGWMKISARRCLP